MTHDEVVRRDVIDRYVRGELEESERNAFEAHFFECQPCFDELQEVERLRSAVRTAAADGSLGPRVHDRPAPPAWAFLLVAASVAAISVAGWLAFYRVPQLTGEIAALRGERDALSAWRPDGSPGLQARGTSEANVPLVMLQAQRDVTSVPAVIVPSAAQRVVLWIEAPASREPARLELQTRDGQVVIHVSNLVRNAQGAYVASVPAIQLPPGTYRVRLFSSSGAASSLLGEYLLDVKTGT